MTVPHIFGHHNTGKIFLSFFQNWLPSLLKKFLSWHDSYVSMMAHHYILANTWQASCMAPCLMLEL